jgi:FkbM family methyltransferase
MSKSLARFLAGFTRTATAWQSRWRRAGTRLLVSQALIEDSRVATQRGALIFRSSHPQALDYPSALLSREPDTIAWIDKFEAPFVLWDVGANVGAYALYAGLDPKSTVIAFEPAAASYAALAENIRINAMDGRIDAYCIALSVATKAGHLNMQNVNAASVAHAFDSLATSTGEAITPQFSQAVIGYRADDFLKSFQVPAPNYLKIDVDSIEIEILTGAENILRSPDLKGVLVEAEGSPERLSAIRQLLTDAGFEEVSEPGAGNMIFARKPS